MPCGLSHDLSKGLSYTLLATPTKEITLLWSAAEAAREGDMFASLHIFLWD